MRRPWVALALSFALPAGCGGSGDGKGRAVTLPAGQGLRVVAREYSFDPSRVTVERPGPLRITLRNGGSLPHDLRVMRAGREIGGTPAFQRGQRTARVRLSRGRYTFLCTVGDHAELGMRGAIQVR